MLDQELLRHLWKLESTFKSNSTQYNPHAWTHFDSPRKIQDVPSNFYSAHITLQRRYFNFQEPSEEVTLLLTRKKIILWKNFYFQEQIQEVPSIINCRVIESTDNLLLRPQNQVHLVWFLPHQGWITHACMLKPCCESLTSWRSFYFQAKQSKSIEVDVSQDLKEVH